MSIVKSKYRGSVTYHLVFAELINAAQYRGNVVYDQVAEIMGIFVRGHHMAAETGRILGEISEDETLAGRPMLSAVAVNAGDLEPSDGFYQLAQQLGLLTEDSSQARERFWHEQRDAVYATWAKPRAMSQPKSAKAPAQ